MTSQRRNGQAALFLLVSLLVVLSFAEFLWRGPLRADSGGDFVAPYVAATRFVRNANPYTDEAFLKDWHDRGAPQPATVEASQHLIAYPPTTLLVFSPFAWLGWRASLTTYVWVCSILYIVLVLLLASEVGSRWIEPKRLGFLAFALALAPIHTGIHLANLTVLSIILCGFAMLAARRDRDILAGILLALSLFFKPTIGFTLLLMLLVMRRWKIIWPFTLVSSVLAGLTLLRVGQLPPIWKHDYQANIQFMFSPNGSASFSNPQPSHFDLLNLQVPVYSITHNVLATNTIVWIVEVSLASLWLLFAIRRSHATRRWEWADVGAASLLGIVPIYQRSYNGAIILFSLLWAFQNVQRTLARVVIAVSCIFLVPGEALIRSLIDPALPESLTNGEFWTTLVLPHASLGIFLLTCLMLTAMRDETRPHASPDSAPPEERPGRIDAPALSVERPAMTKAM